MKHYTADFIFEVDAESDKKAIEGMMKMVKFLAQKTPLSQFGVKGVNFWQMNEDQGDDEPREIFSI